MRLSFPVAAGAVCAVLSMSSSAAAQYNIEYNEWVQDREIDDRQVWLQNRRYREGPGVRVGDFELHPGIGADFGYDSNFLRLNGVENPVGSLILRVSPHFSVATLGPQRRDDGALPDFTFRLGLGATYFEFIPVAGDSANRDRLQEQRNLSADIKATAGIMPGRTWSGRIYAGLSRTVRPTNDVSLNGSYNRLLPQAGAELIWAPGSGVFDWHLGYNFSGRFFESSAETGLNNIRNEITTRGRWRFFPRTALMFDGRFGFLSYPGGTIGNKTDSHPLRVRLGVNGLITQSFAAMALVGWGSSFYAGGQDFDSVIGQLELKWFLNPSRTDISPEQSGASMSSLAIGFVRDFDDAYIGSYFERDMGYAKFSYLIGQSFLLVAEASGGAVVYADLSDFGQTDSSPDMRLEAKLFGEYRILDSVALTGELGYTGYFSDTILTPEPDPNVPDPLPVNDVLAFQRFRAFLGARWFM